MTRQKLYDQAGMLTHDGRLDRLFPIAEWEVPGRVSLESRGNDFFLSADWSTRRTVSATKTLLKDFLRLRQEPGAVLSFASQWGLLGPAEYEARRKEEQEEPVTRWFDCQRMLDATLYWTAQMSRRGPQPNFDDVDAWAEQAVYEDVTGELLEEPPGPRPPDRRSEAQRHLDAVLAVALTDLDGPPSPHLPLLVFRTSQEDLAHHVNTLLRRMMVIPAVNWVGERPVLRISSPKNSLLTALVYRTALAMCRVEDVPICDGCGLVYEPKQRPKSGRRQFCPDCQSAGVPQRFANRAARERKRAASARKKQL